MTSAFVEVVGGTVPWVLVGVIVWLLTRWDERWLSAREAAREVRAARLRAVPSQVRVVARASNTSPEEVRMPSSTGSGGVFDGPAGTPADAPSPRPGGAPAGPFLNGAA